MPKKALKIAVDAKRLFHNREGLGSYARTLVHSMQSLLPQHTYYLCTPELSEQAYAKEFLNVEKYHHITAPNRANKSAWRTKGIVKDLARHNVDVYWGLSNELPIGISKLDCKTLVTIHDLFYKHYPEQFGLLDRWVVGKKYKYATSTADKILVTSQHTKKDLQQIFPKVGKRAEVLFQSTQYEGRAPMRNDKAEPYYLMVGSITPRKNLELVIRTYADLQSEDRKKVVVVGRLTDYANKLKALINKFSLEQYFEFKGQISNDNLWGLYCGAWALIFPSHYEGFGIPVLESLTAGVPVIGSASSSVPEVVGKHGIVIEYDSTESLKAAFMKLKDEDLRTKLLINVDQHLKAFSKAAIVQQIDTIFSELFTKR